MRLFPWLLLSFFQISCLGRQDAQKSPPPNLSLTAKVRQVLVFGANWCKPCRKEIEDFNSIHAEFGAAFEMVGILVEDGKSERPAPADLAKFRSPSGASPVYPVRLDAGWKLFDSFRPPQGRALPLVVLLNPDGQVQSSYQGSIDLEAELIPTLRAWLQNETSVKNPPSPATPEEPELVVTHAIADWLVATENARIQENVRKSWRTGLGKQGFSTVDMPFEEGDITLSRTEPDAPWEVVFARWNSKSNCTLTVRMETDGSYKSSTGICR